MNDVETDLQRSLLEGLLGEKHRGAYTHNAAFHYHMDMLVKMLPLWVDGIAADCEVAEEERREAERLMKTTPFIRVPIEMLNDVRLIDLPGQDKPDQVDDH